MIAKRTGWPRVRRNIDYCLATQSRPAPAATNSAPNTTPTASGPPPPAIARTIIASPITSMATDRICVPVRWTLRGERMAQMLGVPHARGGRPAWLRRRAVGLGAVGVDDDPARALGEDRLHRLAEQRAARARRERDHDRLRTHLPGLVDDHAAGLPRRDLLVVAAHTPTALDARLLDDRLRRELLLGHLGRDRRGRRDRDRHEHVDAAAAAGGGLYRGSQRALGVLLDVEGDEHRLVL